MKKILLFSSSTNFCHVVRADTLHVLHIPSTCSFLLSNKILFFYTLISSFCSHEREQTYDNNIRNSWKENVRIASSIAFEYWSIWTIGGSIIFSIANCYKYYYKKSYKIKTEITIKQKNYLYDINQYDGTTLLN